MNLTIPYADTNGDFFLGNLSDIEISGISGTNVNVTLTASLDGADKYVLNGGYVPDSDGKVRIFDVKSILEPLFTDAIRNGYPQFSAKARENVKLKVDARDSAGTLSKTFQCIFTKGKIDRKPSEFTKFLTLTRNRRCHRKDVQIVSFPAERKCTIGVAYYKADGTPGWKKYDIPASGTGIRTVDVSASAVMKGAGAGDAAKCIYIQAYLVSTDGKTMYDKLHIEIERNAAEENFSTFLYTNFFGMPETMTMRGVPSDEISVEANLGYFCNRISRYDGEIYLRTTANTGALDKEHFEQLTDLLQSPSLYEMINGNGEKPALKDIAIENVDIKRSRISKSIQSASITYVAAERWERRAHIMDTEYDGIFDETFDETFE